MGIIQFPARHDHGDHDPEPTSPRPRSVQCRRGAELQAARERAGMSHEQVAHRRIILLNLRSPGRNGGRPAEEIGDYDLKNTLGYWTRQVARLERTSQDAFDRAQADAERSRAGESSERQRGWRPWPALFEQWLEVVELGHADATVTEIAEAVALAQTNQLKADRQRMRATLEERGRSIARLVWDAAEDVDFLDRALLTELGGEYGQVRLDRWENYLVRVILGRLADELRVVFPGRPRMDEDLAA